MTMVTGLARKELVHKFRHADSGILSPFLITGQIAMLDN